MVGFRRRVDRKREKGDASRGDDVPPNRLWAFMVWYVIGTRTDKIFVFPTLAGQSRGDATYPLRILSQTPYVRMKLHIKLR